MKKQPMQPIELSKQGTPRFQVNSIIEWLYANGRIDLNELGYLKFDDADRMQLAQLLGYSVSGFGDLPYADPGVVADADLIVNELHNPIKENR